MDGMLLHRQTVKISKVEQNYLSRSVLHDFASFNVMQENPIHGPKYQVHVAFQDVLQHLFLRCCNMKVLTRLLFRAAQCACKDAKIACLAANQEQQLLQNWVEV